VPRRSWKILRRGTVISVRKVLGAGAELFREPASRYLSSVSLAFTTCYKLLLVLPQFFRKIREEGWRRKRKEDEGRGRTKK